MLTFNSIDEIPNDFGQSAVTIGKFDGVHLGHQALLAELVDLAESQALAPVVVTFDRHPAALLNPAEAPASLIGPHQKQHLLAEAGVEVLLTLKFDEALAALTPLEFAKTILVDALGAKLVIVGGDFRFGAGGAGTVESLREFGAALGFAVKVVGKIDFDGAPVSTSRIRDLLLQGKVVAAGRLLGRLHTTTGMIEHGLKIGREIGFPTANMSRDAEGFLPTDGVYAGWLYSEGERYMTALSVGINETFQAVPRLIEAHVLDRRDLDLYDKIVTLEYVDYIRPAAKFNGVEDLVNEINNDLDKVRAILG
jgi:riboflavin kinase/FMN adenylyltransferase